MRMVMIPVATLLALSACADEAASTDEVRAAAIERARQELGVSASVPLEATVWVGEEYNGDPVVCGTVSDRTAAESGSVPQRFAASTDPLRWLIFEGAHEPMVSTQPDKFPEWSVICDQETLR